MGGGGGGVEVGVPRGIQGMERGQFVSAKDAQSAWGWVPAGQDPTGPHLTAPPATVYVMQFILSPKTRRVLTIIRERKTNANTDKKKGILFIYFSLAR